jgi:hypothetical protein
MYKSYEKLSVESLLVSELLQNKIIAKILIPRETEVVIKCTDGTRFLYIKQKIVYSFL